MNEKEVKIIYSLKKQIMAEVEAMFLPVWDERKVEKAITEAIEKFIEKGGNSD